MSKKQSNIQNKIRVLRFEHNEMSQATLSDLVGVSRQTIVSIEKGNYTPSLDLAFKICKVFNKKMEDVFFLEESDQWT